MTREETVKKLSEILKYNIASKIFGRDVDRFRKFIDDIDKDIKKLENNKSIVIGEGKIKEALKLGDKILNRATYSEHSKWLRDFITNFSKLVLNWNTELDDDRVRRKYHMASKIMNQSLTIEESQNIMRKLIQRTKKLDRYEPPSFDLSRHYLKSLLDETDSE